MGARMSRLRFSVRPEKSYCAKLTAPKHRTLSLLLQIVLTQHLGSQPHTTLFVA